MSEEVEWMDERMDGWMNTMMELMMRIDEFR
jgi:hypothetical protein